MKVGENVGKKERVRKRMEGEIHLMWKWVIIERKSMKGKKRGERKVDKNCDKGEKKIGRDWASKGRKIDKGRNRERGRER